LHGWNLNEVFALTPAVVPLARLGDGVGGLLRHCATACFSGDGASSVSALILCRVATIQLLSDERREGHFAYFWVGPFFWRLTRHGPNLKLQLVTTPPPRGDESLLIFSGKLKKTQPEPSAPITCPYVCPPPRGGATWAQTRSITLENPVISLSPLPLPTPALMTLQPTPRPPAPCPVYPIHCTPEGLSALRPFCGASDPVLWDVRFACPDYVLLSRDKSTPHSKHPPPTL